MASLRKMLRVYVCMPPRSHWPTAAAFSGGGSGVLRAWFSRCVIHVCLRDFFVCGQKIVSMGPRVGSAMASSAIMTRSGARCLWTSIRRPCGFSESFWQRFCDAFGVSTAELTLGLGGRRLILPQDVFWTSTRKPCGLPTTKLSVGYGGHPFSLT